MLIPPFQPTFYALITFFFVFPSFFPFLSNNCNYGNLFSYILFTITYQKMDVNVVKTICLSNNLSMHIRENTDFPRQKPRQLPSTEANFEAYDGYWQQAFCIFHIGILLSFSEVKSKYLAKEKN